MATAIQYSEESVTKTTPADGRGHHLGILAGLFLGGGLIVGLNEILLAHLTSSFGWRLPQSTWVTAALFAACLFLAIPAARLLERFGVQRTIIVAMLAIGAGALLFLAAAGVASRGLFVAALVMMASGMTALLVAANLYVAVAGRTETASSRLSLAHAFGSLGYVLAPATGGLMIVSAAPLSAMELHSLSAEALHYYRVAEAASVKIPYVLLGVLAVVMAVVVGSVRLRDVSRVGKRHDPTIAGRLWRDPDLILASIAVFASVGAAASIGKILADYAAHPAIGNVSVKAAARVVSLYWVGVAGGQFIGAGLLRRVRTEMLLAVCACASVVLVFPSMLTSGPLAMWSVAASGLFQSIMFPSVFALGVVGLRSGTYRGAGVMIMGVCGGAVFPAVQALLAEYIGLQRALIVPVFCFVYVFFFALRSVKRSNDALRWSVADHKLS